MGSLSQPKFPVIDFTKENLKQGTSSWTSVGHEVRDALEKYGCFVALYDKVSPELSDATFSMLEQTFDLPTEVKMKNIPNRPYHGYVGPKSANPIYESLGIEDVLTANNVEEFSCTLWRSGNDNFCKIMHSYVTRVAELEHMVLKMVFESYGVGKLYESVAETSSYLLRINKYRAPQKSEPSIGSLPHSDVSFLTILHQNEVNGLEVQMGEGEYVGVDLPSISSFIVMAGDALMAWSNDRVQSAMHRVVMSGDKDRYSTALFTYIKGVIQIPEELVDDDHPRKFKPFDHYGLLGFKSTIPPTEMEERAVVVYCGA